MLFAVVDDEAVILRQVSSMLKEIISDQNLRIDLFQDSVSFINSYKQKDYDAFFLDIDMPEINGFEIAKILNSENCKVPVIYVTGRDELIIQAFRYRPLGFVRKQNIAQELEFAVSTIIETIHTSLKTISVSEIRSQGGKTHNLVIDDIVYLESNNHNISVHMKNNRKIIIRQSLSFFQKNDLFKDFIQISSGILINMNHLDNIENENAVLSNGKKMHISRRNLKAVRETSLKLQRRTLI